MKIDFKVRGSKILYGVQGLSDKDTLTINGLNRDSNGQFLFDINWEVISTHSIILNGKDISDTLTPLFSRTADSSIWAFNRHPDEETQTYIAYQNARFSDDLAFRYSMAVVLGYRVIENDFLLYESHCEPLFNELLSRNNELTDHPSIRQNREHLFFSLSYVLLLFYLYKGNQKKFISILQTIISKLEYFINNKMLRISVINIIKPLMLTALLYSKSDKKEVLKIAELARHIAQRAFSYFKGSFEVIHLKEFDIPFLDIVKISYYSRILNGGVIDQKKIHFKYGTLSEIEHDIFMRALRIKKNHQKLRDNLDKFRNDSNFLQLKTIINDCMINLQSIDHNTAPYKKIKKSKTFTIVDKIIKSVNNQPLSNKIDETEKNHTMISVDFDNLKIIDGMKKADALRDIAIAFEESGDIITAEKIMQQALILRPNGPVIQKKHKEYITILNNS